MQLLRTAVDAGRQYREARMLQDQERELHTQLLTYQLTFTHGRLTEAQKATLIWRGQ
jgi:hypothetical protein